VAEETTHKGVPWHRDDQGSVSFYDADRGEWVRWAAGADSPPLPPKWQMLGVPTRVSRPGWGSPWRIIPVVLVISAVLVALFQVTSPSPDHSAAEAKASAALLGKCLAKSGHGFSSDPVPCTSPKAAVKVMKVIASTGRAVTCPAGTTGVELFYPGVAHLHVECVAPVEPPG
jgi:hypothetical protein